MHLLLLFLEFCNFIAASTSSYLKYCIEECKALTDSLQKHKSDYVISASTTFSCAQVQDLRAKMSQITLIQAQPTNIEVSLSLTLPLLKTALSQDYPFEAAILSPSLLLQSAQKYPDFFRVAIDCSSFSDDVERLFINWVEKVRSNPSSANIVDNPQFIDEYGFAAPGLSQYCPSEIRDDILKIDMESLKASDLTLASACDGDKVRKFKLGEG